eukprot:TRINITY_DN17834_c1_g2_i1.p1 TRINITY_DN17834_c1_g2~~TRINITY_DN17834_c1_g2_i1.p1  ORF type:complete len:525 (-),score=58.14 TRINITY_DN17834_c1_g2_i1:165-1739(-)
MASDELSSLVDGVFNPADHGLPGGNETQMFKALEHQINMTTELLKTMTKDDMQLESTATQSADLARFEEMVTYLEELMNSSRSKKIEVESSVDELEKKKLQLIAQRDRLQLENAELLKETERRGGTQRTDNLNTGEVQYLPFSNSGISDRAEDARADSQAPWMFYFEAQFTDHEKEVHSCAMGVNQTLATASWDGTVCLYDLSKPNRKASIRLGRWRNTDKGKQAVKLNKEDTRRKKPGKMDGKMDGLYCVALDKRRSDILGCASCDHTAYIWKYDVADINRCSLLAELKAHSNEVNSIDFHAVQAVVCTASDDQTCRVWDLNESTVLRLIDKPHTAEVYGATFFAGDRLQYNVATCCFDKKARVFDMRSKNVVVALSQHTNNIIGITTSPDSNYLATGGEDGFAYIYDTRKWMKVHTIDGSAHYQEASQVKRMSFSPDGRYLAAACSSGYAKVYSVNPFSPVAVASIGPHKECVFDVCWGTCSEIGSPLLATASHDHTCQYWRGTRGSQSALSAARSSHFNRY